MVRQVARRDAVEAAHPALQPAVVGVHVLDVEGAVAHPDAGRDVDRFVADAARGGEGGVALQLCFSLQVRAPCGGLVRASPERPGDDVGGPDAPLGEPDGDAADLLDRPADEVRVRARPIKVFGGAATFARWRTAASMAEAGMTSETWRCQPCQL